MNQGYTYVLQIGPQAAGLAVAHFLATEYPHSTVEEWESRIAAGSVRLDGDLVGGEARLRPGQTLTWERPPWTEPDAPASFAVLHRDSDLLGVAKPAGLPTLPGAGFFEQTLLSLVRAFDPEAAPLHRLGRFTSGVVLFARNREARAHLARQFALRSVGRLYRALAAGTPDRDSFEVNVPIGPVSHDVLGTVHGATASGRAAHSEVEVVARREGAFLCDVRIATGRPHQIRIHLAAAGYPLLGDPLYAVGGVPAPGCTALPGDAGYGLHASELRITHPRTGESLVLACMPPQGLRA